MSMFFYRVVLRLARPIVRLRLRRRARREPEYGNRVSERFGDVPDQIPTGVVWFHTVSAGETIAATPLIRELKEAFPNLPFLNDDDPDRFRAGARALGRYCVSLLRTL